VSGAHCTSSRYLAPDHHFPDVPPPPIPVCNSAADGCCAWPRQPCRDSRLAEKNPHLLLCCRLLKTVCSPPFPKKQLDPLKVLPPGQTTNRQIRQVRAQGNLLTGASISKRLGIRQGRLLGSLDKTDIGRRFRHASTWARRVLSSSNVNAVTPNIL
jgi:hypothetical protein